VVTKDTRKNSKRLSPRSTASAQALPFRTFISEQDTRSNRAPAPTHLSRRMVLKTGLAAAVVATGIGTWLELHPGSTHAILLQTTNAAIQWDNAVLQAIRNVGMGPTPASRAIAITHTCMYDAWATYDAVAVATRPNGIPRQAGKYTDATMAVSYAAYRALLDLFPSQAPLFTALMNNLGYDPSNTSTDTTTQVGVGNAAAQAVLAFRHTDGSNQAGNYADTSGYVPVNTPDQIIDPTRWQPMRVSNGNGGFVVQKYLTPHWGTVTPFALTAGSQFRPAGPIRDATSSAYQSQVDQILQYSAQLNDQTKTIADYWANGPHTETPPGHWDVFAQCYIAQYLSLKYKHDLNHDIKMFFALSNALFDAGIAAWDCKRAYDYVRPITAVHYPHTGQHITAWAGYGKGTQSIDGGQWIPYQEPTIVTPPSLNTSPGIARLAQRGLTFCSKCRAAISLVTPTPQRRVALILSRGSPQSCLLCSCG